MSSSALALILFCIQNVFIFSAVAGEPSLSETGSTIDSVAIEESAPKENSTSESGSVLPIEEIHELESSSEENISPAPLTLTLSPLLIRISEVAWMGSDVSTADEWVELSAIPLMTGSVLTEPFNLRGWTLTIQKDTGESVIASFDHDIWIESGSYVVVANNAATSSRLKREPIVISTSMSLPNTKLLLRLRAPDGSVQDIVDDFVGAPFAGLNPSASSGLPKATMERVDLRASGTDKANWQNAQTSRGFDLHSLMLGTPGYQNGSVEPPDTTPPPDLLHARAYRFSGSLLIDWKSGFQSDASTIRLVTSLQTLDLPASSTGIVIGDDERISALRLQTIDESGNMSPGIDVPIVLLEHHLIQEILPDPGTGKEEWIELGNPHAYPIDLQGFVLESGTKRFHVSGALLEPGKHQLFGSFFTNLQLPNSGGEVRLKFLGKVIDTLIYPDLPTGISYGRRGELAQPYCVVTPSMSNAVYPLSIRVDGVVPDTLNPSSLNLSILALSGSLAGAACIVDFADGTVSNSCNPPNHSMRISGNLVLHVEVKDYCDNTVIQNIPVTIESKRTSKTSLVELATPSQCTPTATGGIILSEFLPAPVKGGDEWIELHNPMGYDIDLCGWSVDDMHGGSKPYHLDDTVLRAGEYLVLSSSLTGVSLNNDADTVRLIAPLSSGGTGILLQIPYMDSPSGESFALREDGVSLWSPFLTPGMPNRFVPIDISPGTTSIIVEAALPNPVGPDTWDEWVELKNLTGRPQWLNGWVLERIGGSRLKLDGKVLSKKETMRLPMAKTSLVLGNAKDTLKLFDEQGILRSVIAWEAADEGHVIRQPSDCEIRTIEKPVMMDPFTYRGFDPEAETGVTVHIEGLQPAPMIDSTLFASHINDIVNFSLALIKDKKIEYKNCSKSGESSLAVDGSNIAFLQLQSGLVIVDPTPSPMRGVYLAYEQEALANRRGIWTNPLAFDVVTAWKSDRTLDAIVENEGLVLTASKPSALLMTGALVTVEANVPADLWVRRGTGSWRPFDGGVYVASAEELTFRARYAFKATPGSGTKTVEVRRMYGMVEDSYPDCLKISESYPSPKSGEREWVELFNTCTFDVSLWGWMMDDEQNAGSKPFTFGTGTLVPSSSFYVLSGSLLPLTLNNGGDAVALVSPDKRLKDILTYKSVTKGKSVIFSTEGVCMTIEPTPGRPNFCRLPQKAPSKSVKAVKTVKNIIGVGSKFSSIFSAQILTKNTKNDHSNALLEGLNMNIGNNYVIMSFYSVAGSMLFVLGFAAVASAVTLYCRKYGLWQ